ncbi:MAG: 1-deoxy-D-xylulose-5-phosphate synthase [Aestuariivirga sp.]|nr:1-deoxy-D-xylulose-5-phosphate synthase [Aestuariivirga sp.]
MSTPKSRIMYIERKAEGLNGPAWIGRVTFSKSGRTMTYRGRQFQKMKGYKCNCFDVENGDEYWISGPRRNGKDRLYPASRRPVEIDGDVRVEYMSKIRGILA